MIDFDGGSHAAQLIDVLGLLQLPTDPAVEPELAALLDTLTQTQGLEAGDLYDMINADLEAWSNTSIASDSLKTTVTGLLNADFGHASSPLSGSSYFLAYSKMRAGGSDWTGVSHAQARRLLSRSSLVKYLLVTEHLSCSQISRLLHTTEASLDVPYPAVRVLARELDALPQLDSAVAGLALWNKDQERSRVLFPDSDRTETCRVAAEVIQAWLPEEDLYPILQDVTSSRGLNSPDPFWPYLQMLHWCCLPLEFYDHPASYLYEFKPRGAIAADLFDRYRTATGNPILNNAKAVQTLNESWARNRGGRDSLALVALLKVLESLPFGIRRQVARVLRAFLARILDLCFAETVPIPPLTHVEDVERVFARFIRTDSNTQGVIEQRLADCLAFLAFPETSWRSRGLGDGVNASNLSRKKLGDVEFLDVEARTAVAVEAHGGHLSASYVAGHQRSLARIVAMRVEDSWSQIAPAEEWVIRVLFVAHSRDQVGLPSSELLSGVDIQYEYVDYDHFYALARTQSTSKAFLSAYNILVTRVMNRPTVRQSARNVLRAASS